MKSLRAEQAREAVNSPDVQHRGPSELPDDVTQAKMVYEKTRDAYYQAWDAYDKAEGAYRQAEEAYNEAIHKSLFEVKKAACPGRSRRGG